MQRRPTIETYDELFDCIIPTYAPNRMIKVNRGTGGFVVPLCQPPWCTRPMGEEFQSFTECFEWLNPGATRAQVVRAWMSLGWTRTGGVDRAKWACRHVRHTCNQDPIYASHADQVLSLTGSRDLCSVTLGCRHGQQGRASARGKARAAGRSKASCKTGQETTGID